MPSSSIAHQTPFSDNPDWYYNIYTWLSNADLHSLNDDGPRRCSPSLIIYLNFATQTISSLMSQTFYSNDEEFPLTIETKRFSMLDIWEMNQQHYAEQVINSFFMDTTNGAALSIERRQCLVSNISNIIKSFLEDGSWIEHDQILIDLEVVELEQDEDLSGMILQESFENAELRACPAPQALLESLVTEVFCEEEEAVKCMICLDELVTGTEVKRLPCSHLFHGDCIDGWFAQKDSCPLCRFTLHA
ncbi:Zinc finger RING/FYVE/PHD-type protein [Dioscorea alata]|uniref:Zinc finger RING/FYVE/PHD-type protein n=1 Tax=Dioscorea alata TaxID=55571 RepID=A0ACB7WEG1_DIOAL|nr:Zinc finger RING/FYVE/PHD-type protein [Dioscorea alata]